MRADEMSAAEDELLAPAVGDRGSALEGTERRAMGRATRKHSPSLTPIATRPRARCLSRRIGGRARSGVPALPYPDFPGSPGDSRDS